jgi:hypothetical protein
MWDFLGDSMDGIPEEISLMIEDYDSEANLTVDQVAAGMVAVGCPMDVALERASILPESEAAEVPEAPEDDGENRPALTTSRNAVGAHSVFCVMCEQAIKDVRALMAAKVILPNGTIQPNWPPDCKGANGKYKPYSGVVGYTGRGEVQDLLYWMLEGGMEREMRDLGVQTPMQDIFDAIGITKSVQHSA